MAELLLFHHAQGLTPGILGFADTLRAAGHRVHTPDLYEGRTFATLDEGIAHADEIGFGAIIERGTAAARDLPADLVYAGFSLGVLPAQSLAQNRPGARGALLVHSCVPASFVELRARPFGSGRSSCGGRAGRRAWPCRSGPPTELTA